jgi:hypothetical protein
VLTVENLKLYGHTYILYHKQRPLSATTQLLLKLLRRRRQKQTSWVKSPGDIFSATVAVLAHVWMSQMLPDISVLSELVM